MKSNDVVAGEACENPWTVWRWIVYGLRMSLWWLPGSPWRVRQGLFRGLPPVRVAQLLAIWVCIVATQLFVEWLATPSPSRFVLEAELQLHALGVVQLVLIWAMLQVQPARTSSRIAASGSVVGHVGNAWVLAGLAALPYLVLATGFSLLSRHVWGVWDSGAEAGSGLSSPNMDLWRVISWVTWLGYWLCVFFAEAATIAVVAGYAIARRTLVAGAAFWAMFVVCQQYFLPIQSWQKDYAAVAAADESKEPQFQLTQSLFEAQAKALERALSVATDQAKATSQGTAPRVFGVLYAPYASENVFRNEVRMVQEVLALHHGDRAISVPMVNQRTSTVAYPWATPENLRKTIAQLGAQMQAERDVMFVYLTSHGSKDHRLSSDFWPLEVQDLQPSDLLAMLDQAQIKYRVITVSACYAGGWVVPMATENSLVMTAADAEHTSYGCGRKSDLTFFGRAVFDEEYRKTGDFETALTHAIPNIKNREDAAKKKDGFSNPQIHVGQAIRSKLLELQAAKLGTKN